ncbi:peptide ABC transporter ATP-binding protein [Brachybacterium vulturis]|uniref:Peptide ABC transporter ATP-binding protein n=2 Tax=Brachybacterium vulturis TaxID=2017484 RepID=A0A291GS03_9MICO|nr:peptide ABC transporter ATP-binding protein [Brachybacterium vulturis]
MVEGSAWHSTVESGGDVLEIADLRIDTTSGGRPIIKGVDLRLRQGELLALVGESGSGKTTVGLAVLGRFRRGLTHVGGTVTVHPSNHTSAAVMTDLGEEALRRLRGSRVSYIPQDPALSLNPAMRVGEQISEVLEIHEFGADDAERTERVRGVLREVGLPDDDAYRRRWPHELSGGQQQRIGIAMAFAMYPDVLVLDEPTTGLDVSTQAVVLETIREMTVKNSVAGLYITHDLAVVAEIADRVAVMLQGELVEEGPTADVLGAPQHRYTRTLLAAVPDLAGKNNIGEFEARRKAVQAAEAGEAVRPATTSTSRDADTAAAPATEAASGDPLLEVRDVSLSYGTKQVLTSVDLTLRTGECTLLLGESGSGKTTLSRAIAGLLDHWSGSVRYREEELPRSTRRRSLAQRQDIQYVFQSPFSSLNPRRTLGQSLAVPLEMSGELSASQRRERVREALDSVRLGRSFFDRRPGDLSGGERQRAAIARALVNMPRVLVCDEITSALDVSVQASIIDLLSHLRQERGLSMLFVTHNIALARHVAERVAVLDHGVIVDDGPTDQVLTAPSHSYTEELLQNIPTL